MNDLLRTPSLAERLAAAQSGLAVGPAEPRGLFCVAGTKRIDFLHRMSTQKLAGMPPGSAIHTAFLDPKARVLGEGTLLVREDDVLLDVDPAALPELLAHLGRFVLRDDVKLTQLPGLRVVPAFGAAAEIGRAHPAVVAAWPNPRRGAPAWDLVVEEGGAGSLRRALLERGAVALTAEDLEALRIAAGVPRWGAEVDAARLVMEAALTRTSVSFDKGCYLGQEIVLRGTFRGQVQRGLVQLELPPGAGVGAKLSAVEQPGKEVGVVTSAADLPEGRLGLGYLRRAFWGPGTRLATEGGEAVVRRALVEEKD